MSKNTYTALVIPEDPNVDPYKVDIERADSLGALQRIVGGYIEALPVRDRPDLTAYVHEEGKFVCQANGRATQFMARGLFAGDYIAGNLVICGFDAGTGENLDCPVDVLMLVSAATHGFVDAHL
jgi:hypothetical protein